MALGMSPGKAAAYGQGAVAGDVDPDPSVGFSPGEGPEQEPAKNKNIVEKAVSFVSGLFSTAGQKAKQQYSIKGTGVPTSQNFLQKNTGIQALLDKGYTISKSGNTLYSPYNENLVSARDKAENEFTGIDPEVAFRGAVAGINPDTGMMWSGGTKGGALDQLTNTMITPSRAKQNIARTNKYKAQSDAALGGLLTPEQREKNKKSSFFGFDLDGDGNPFTSTNKDGVVFGMSNAAIYDPSIQSSAYRGIPSSYAKGSPTFDPATIDPAVSKTFDPATGALGDVYGGQKTSEDRMLFNEAMELAMPGSFIVKGANYVKDMLSPKQQAQEAKTDDSSLSNLSIDELIEKAKSQIAPYGEFEIKEPVTSFNNMTPIERQNFRNLPKTELPVTTIKLDDLETESNFENFIYNDPYGNAMYSNNPIVGYQMDGRTPIYANDPDAGQYPYANVYP